MKLTESQINSIVKRYLLKEFDPGIGDAMTIGPDDKSIAELTKDAWTPTTLIDYIQTLAMPLDATIDAARGSYHIAKGILYILRGDEKKAELELEEGAFHISMLAIPQILESFFIAIRRLKTTKNVQIPEGEITDEVLEETWPGVIDAGDLENIFDDVSNTYTKAHSTPKNIEFDGPVLDRRSFPEIDDLPEPAYVSPRAKKREAEIDRIYDEMDDEFTDNFDNTEFPPIEDVELKFGPETTVVDPVTSSVTKSNQSLKGIDFNDRLKDNRTQINLEIMGSGSPSRVYRNEGKRLYVTGINDKGQVLVRNADDKTDFFPLTEESASSLFDFYIKKGKRDEVLEIIIKNSGYMKWN